MVRRTKAANLKEINAMMSRTGSSYRIMFAGYMPTGRIGGDGKTRHYMYEIVSGENAGATYGDYFEIDFNAYDEEIVEEEIS